ncbi:MAG: glycoside hydrolase family 35 [Myxococcales bacterium]|nr:glycoside hydrolase family 35 [Myxococcales bacterium]
MEARRRTWFDAHGLTVAAIEGGTGERRLPFYAGAMHYWRVAPTRWTACLRAIHEQGLTIVETYVPWREHETADGAFDWRGAKDLGAFLEAARAAGLSVVLRPGPHVNAELTSFGIPDHVLADAASLARTAHGTTAWMPSPPRAWPIPSYASAAFQRRVHAWYAAVAAVVTPHLAPEGPVVAFGVDNEAQLFFRLGAYDIDYHPDALAWWRDASGLEGAPPRAWDPAEAARCVSWVRFKDQYIARALGDFAKMLDDVGLGHIARFHNLPPGHHGHYDLRRIQHAIGGPVGIDAYSTRADLRDLRRRATALVGNADPVPLALEVGVGFFPWFPPLDHGDDKDRERDQLLTLLSAGARGFNLYMAVERDRFYGAAITKDGKVESHAAWIRVLVAALHEVDWTSLRRVTPIALIDAKADARFGLATCVPDPMTPVLAELLGMGAGGAAELGTDASAITARRWQTALASALELAQVPYAIVDESASEDELARYRAVIVPTLDRIDHGLWQRIRALAEHKRAIIVVGPGSPTLDELGQPLIHDPPRRIGKIRAASLDDLPGLAADLAALAGDLPDAWQIERPDDVRAFAYADPSGTTKVVFVVSDAPRPVTAILLTDAATTTLRDPFTNEILRVTNGKASIALPARGVRMLLT